MEVLKEIMNFCDNNKPICFIAVLALLYCMGFFDSFMKEPFSLGGILGDNNNMQEIKAAEPGKQTTPQTVSDLGRTPSSCILNNN